MTALLVDGSNVATKTCSACGETKVLEDFYRRGGGKRGATCKPCRAASQRALYARYPERYQGYNRLNRYKALGLTADVYKQMLAEQEGVCALCGKPPSNESQNSALLHLDHCHATGKIRRLLCHHCNMGLGRFFDDPDLLRKAADYIEAYR